LPAATEILRRLWKDQEARAGPTGGPSGPGG
jgi:hypothetical protein